MDWVVISLLSLAIVSVAAISDLLALRRDRDTKRGSLPGDGTHIIEANYSSGVGGGHSTTYEVPKDPQAYAKYFIPREKRK